MWRSARLCKCAKPGLCCVRHAPTPCLVRRAAASQLQPPKPLASLPLPVQWALFATRPWVSANSWSSGAHPWPSWSSGKKAPTVSPGRVQPGRGQSRAGASRSKSGGEFFCCTIINDSWFIFEVTHGKCVIRDQRITILRFVFRYCCILVPQYIYVCILYILQKEPHTLRDIIVSSGSEIC